MRVAGQTGRKPASSRGRLLRPQPAERRRPGDQLKNEAQYQKSDLAATPTAVIGPWSLRLSTAWSTLRMVPCADR